MNKELLKQPLEFAAQVLSQDYDLLYFNPDTIHTENNMMGAIFNVKNDFTSSVRGIELVQLINKLPDQIELKATEKSLSIKGGGISVKLRSSTNKNKKPTDFTKVAFQELPETFLPAVTACLPTVSDKEIQGILTGLHITPDMVLACNNITVTKYEGQTGVEKPFTIPKAAANLLVNFKPKFICLEKNKAIFANEDKSAFIYSVLMAGKYPTENMVKLLGSSGEDYTLPDTTSDSVGLTSLFSYEAEDGANYIQVDIQEDKVVVSGSKNFGSLEDTIEHKSTKTAKFYIDPMLLSKAMTINKTFAHCDKYLIFNNKNIKHLICLVNKD